MSERKDVIVIGAGQAGLAASACLSAAGIDHAVLERGAVGERWRNERWASLRLLTPNWMTRLPGYAYEGQDADGYMHKDELTGLLTRYARRIGAPVRGLTPVEAITRDGDGFRVETSDGTIRARAVIVATGACDRPAIPSWAGRLAPRFDRITTHDYIHPGQIAPGGVLVVGASATGVQLADEIRRAGHEVTIAAGRHMPLPRVYRGYDIMAWLDMAGFLSETRNPDIGAARTLRHPSLQLVGGLPRRDISLGTLAQSGVRPVSRAIGAEDGRLLLTGRLEADVKTAAYRARTLLGRIDAFIEDAGIPALPMGPVAMPDFAPDTREMLDLDRAGIRTIVWATGFRRDYSWLRLPVLDAHGEIREQGGITAVPGLYALGLPFMRRRNSAFIDGVGADARDIVSHLASHLGSATLTSAA